MDSEENGYVFRATLELNGLIKVLVNLFPANAAAIVRRVDGAEFVTFHSEEVNAFLARWTEGQVFTECQIFNVEAELRWRQAGNIYNVLLLTEKATPPVDFQTLTRSPFTITTPSHNDAHGFLLWGTRRDRESWLEARIPRALNYPTQTSARPRLSYHLYKDGETVCWVRLRDLKEAK